jgi:hypothetical protein
VGGLSALAAALVGGVVYFAAFRDDGVTLVVPSPTIAIQKTVETIKEVKVEVPSTPSASDGKPSKPRPAAAKPTGDAPPAKPAKKKCPPSDPLCGIDL